MGVERVDYYSDDEYRQALQQEQQEREQQERLQDEELSHDDFQAVLKLGLSQKTGLPANERPP